MPMPRLLLVRHAQSEWNAQGRWQGQADPPLSVHGRHQANVAAQRIGAVDAIWSSTLERAAVTAEIIAGTIGVGPVIGDDRLIERDAGEWSGLTRAEIKAAWPGYLAEDPEDRAAERRPPSWEPDSSLLVRARAALRDVIEPLADGDTALVVTHGGVIYALEAQLGAPRRYLPNLGARWLELAGTASEPKFVLGDRVHLYDPDDDPRHEADGARRGPGQTEGPVPDSRAV